MLAGKRMLGAMVTKREAKQAVARLRKGVDPKFKKEIDAVADCLDEIIESAADLGRQGGRARAKSLTAKERKAISSKAARARWSKEKSNGSKKSGK